MVKIAAPVGEQTGEHTPAEVLVGRKLRELRQQRGLSLRALAERSGLNINTLSLVENGKSSPSVGTLQQLALALETPLSSFFEADPVSKQVVFTPADRRPSAVFGTTQMENLTRDLAGNRLQSFVVTLEPGAGSGDQRIVHTGHEFVYCLSGLVHYRVLGVDYMLAAGDTLVFEAHLPHCWENLGDEKAKIVLVFVPADERDEPGDRHIFFELMTKEFSMKVAVITDDGKTISQHFGRAAYYKVLTIEDGKVVAEEMRNKMGHTHFQNTAHEETANNSQGHGMDAASHNKHISMAETIADCKALICGGMGMGAYDSMRRLNIQPIVTELSDIETAVQAYIDGKLVDHTEMLH